MILSTLRKCALATIAAALIILALSLMVGGN